MNANVPPSPGTPGTSGSRPDDDALLARVRAADPARDAEPDHGVLRAAVDERRTADVPRSRTPDELAAARARRWTTWPARVAGVAAAALLVGGGGGYAIGAAGRDVPEPAAGVITLDGGAQGAGGAAPESAGAAATDGAATSARAGSDMWPGSSGRTVFTSSGLSDEGGTAPAWSFDASASFTETSAAAVASALGVPGEPVQTDGAWTVGSTDGTAAAVTLYADGTTSMSYYDPTTDPWACPSGEASAREGAADDSGVVPPEPEPCTERDLGPAPTGDAATDRVRELLTALGLDPAAFELVLEDYSDEGWTYVSAYQVLDGQRTGVVWNASFTGAGLQSLYGSLAPLVALGDYEVVSPTAAVERMGDPRFGPLSGGGPIAYAEDTASSPDTSVQSEPSSAPTVPAPVGPGSAISWPVDEVTIVGARLGSALHVQADGAALLLPTYELTGSDGGIWTVLAVADSRLDLGAGQ